jgi:hypothetical protein
LLFLHIEPSSKSCLNLKEKIEKEVFCGASIYKKSSSSKWVFVEDSQKLEDFLLLNLRIFFTFRYIGEQGVLITFDGGGGGGGRGVVMGVVGGVRGKFRGGCSPFWG